MKCPNCNEEIDVFDEVCPHCKVNLDEFEEKQKIEEAEETVESKTKLLKVINVFQLIGCIIYAIICWSNYNTFQGFMFVIIGLITFAFIKGFSDIIDLLNSIDNKLK